MPFQKGQSGNPGGRPKSAWTFASLLREALEKKSLDGDEVKHAVMNALVDKAVEGDVQAIKEIANRIDGMPVQKQVLAGDEENPVKIDISGILNKVYGSSNTESTGTVHPDSSETERSS